MYWQMSGTYKEEEIVIVNAWFDCWEHICSGGKVQDFWSLDYRCCEVEPATASVYVSLGKICILNLLR